MYAYIRNLNTRKDGRIDLTDYSTFEDAKKAVRDMVGDADYEVVDFDPYVPFVTSLEGAWAYSQLENDGVDFLSEKMSVVLDYLGYDMLDDAAKNTRKLQDLYNAIESVMVIDDIDDWVLGNLEDSVPANILPYIDTERWFRDYTLDLDGRVMQQEGKTYIYVA